MIEKKEMTIEKINLLLEEIERKKEILKEKSKQDAVKAKKFEDFMNLTAEYFTAKQLYKDYSTLLAFSYPEELSDDDWVKIEKMMPSLKKHIETLEEKLDTFK